MESAVWKVQLFNEHGGELNSQEIVENVRVCTVKRRPRCSSEREKALFRGLLRMRDLLLLWGCRETVFNITVLYFPN